MYAPVAELQERTDVSVSFKICILTSEHLGHHVIVLFVVIVIPAYECVINKVNRCLARYSPRATTTNPPTNRAPKKPAWPKWTKNANFGPNLVVFGQKSFFLLEKS